MILIEFIERYTIVKVKFTYESIPRRLDVVFAQRSGEISIEIDLTSLKIGDVFVYIGVIILIHKKGLGTTST